jgi:hypothetical protein
MADKRYTALLALGAACAAALVITGSAASAGTSSSTDIAAANAAVDTAHRASTVGFTDYTDNDGLYSTAILTGGIGDFGQGVSVYPDGTPNPEHNSQLELDLRDGSFRIDFASLDAKFVSTLTSFPADTATCSGIASAEGAAPIVKSSGTGAYRGVSGTFHLKITLAEVDEVAGCRNPDVLLKQLIVITGSGAIVR